MTMRKAQWLLHQYRCKTDEHGVGMIIQMDRCMSTSTGTYRYRIIRYTATLDGNNVEEFKRHRGKLYDTFEEATTKFLEMVSSEMVTIGKNDNV
jgi:hypothetical protein